MDYDVKIYKNVYILIRRKFGKHSKGNIQLTKQNVYHIF